jgi:hypothetical protein
MRYRQPQSCVGFNPAYNVRFAFNAAIKPPAATYINTSTSVVIDGVAQNFVGGLTNNSYINHGTIDLTDHFNTATPSWGLVVVDVKSLPGNFGIIGKNDSANGGGWSLVWLAGTTTLEFRLINTGNNSTVVSVAGSLTTGRHVIIFTYNGKIITAGSQKLYLDGIDIESVQSTSGSGSNLTDAGQTLYIGQENPPWGYRCLDGEMSLAAFGYGTLTNKTIAELSANPWQIFKPQQRILQATSGGSNLNITATIGTGTADGIIAQVDRQLSINGLIGTATADGLTAQVDTALEIQATLGNCIANGIVSAIDLHLIVNAGVGIATADGYITTITGSFPASGSGRSSRIMFALMH